MSSSELAQYLILFCSAVLGGGINAVAGGGTLLTFPTLYGILGPTAAVIANATSTVALFPGSVSAIGAFWDDLKLYRRWVVVLMPPSLLGGFIGAWLLTYLPATTFQSLVPWLIFVAASLFTLQPQIAKWLGIGQAHAAPAAGTLVGVVVFQLLVGIYGGYFGAGIGILMLSSLAVMGLTDIHAMNGLKSVLGTCINGIAVAVFVVQDVFSQKTVHWPLAIWMACGAAVGAWFAARLAKRIDRVWVRRFVIAIGYLLAATFFYRQYMAG